jgi:hypothetical protein
VKIWKKSRKITPVLHLQRRGRFDTAWKRLL